MDINALLEQPSTASSPGNASTSSRKSTSSSSSSRGRRASGSAHMSTSSTMTAATTPASMPGPPILEPQHPHHYHYSSHPSHYPTHHYAAAHGPSPYHTSPYQGYPPSSMPGQYAPPPMHVSVQGPSNKRLAPPHPLPGESPAKKKQSKWTADEDASIIELRGNGMKWEDISKHLPGRSAISCRLRFQNYLERRSEWDEEKKNKLARLYERFKKDMWEKISKEMALPWRAAEAMHWQIGEVEMAQRANVPVFHLAGQQQQQQQHVATTTSTSYPAAEPHSTTRSTTNSPTSTISHLPPAYTHSHAHGLQHTTHSHSLPQSIPRSHQQISYAKSTTTSPTMSGHHRNSASLSPHSTTLPQLNRSRADSAKDISTLPGRPALPSLSELSAAAGAGAGVGVRYSVGR